MSERRTNVVQMIWITTHAKGSFYAAYFVVIFWVTGLVLYPTASKMNFTQVIVRSMIILWNKLDYIVKH